MPMMNRTILTLSALLAMLGSVAVAQIEITRTERLDLGSGQQWDHPQFSPDGRTIYYTTAAYDGIWSYSTENGLRQITADPKSGYGFSVSPNGDQIAYRRSTMDSQTRRRSQELVVTDLRTGQSTTIASGPSLPLPSFGAESLIYSNGSTTQGLSKQNVPGTTLLGIESTKIAISRNGNKELLDPFGDGRYIWPSLSPGGSSIVAYEMGRGTIVMTVDGEITTRLGKKNAPVWTRDGKYIIYMEDRDDGHRILSSDLFCVSPDGSTTTQLTRTDNVTELFPACSPTEDKIVTSSLEGSIYVLSYREVTP
jgi:Tol biopolymer transport system component